MENTIKASKAYDEDKPRRDALWDSAATNEDVRAAVAEDERAADDVRAAFFEDTKDVNSRDRAFLVHPDDPWLRKLASSST